MLQITTVAAPLIMADEFRIDMAAKRKFITFIKGWCDERIKPNNDALIVGTGNKWGCTVVVKRVTFCTLASVPYHAMRLGGYINPADMRTKMRKHHSDMRPESPITIIEWKEIRNWWGTA